MHRVGMVRSREVGVKAELPDVAAIISEMPILVVTQGIHQLRLGVPGEIIVRVS